MAMKKSGARSPAKKAKAPSDAAAHNVTLADHEKRITALEDRHPQLGALCEDMRSHISFLAEKIVAMQESGNRQHLELKQAMHAELSAMALIVRDVADGQATLAEGQASIEKGQAAIASRMDNLEASVVRLEQRTTKVEDRLTKIEDRLTKVEDRLTKVEDRLTKVEDRLTKVEDRLTGLEGRTSGVETAIREFACGQDEHARRLERLERAEG